MKYRRKLFKSKKPYKYNDKLFYEAIKENFLYHYQRNQDYKQLIDHMNFNIDDFKSIDDLSKITPITTLYLKKHNLFTKDFDKCFIKSYTSGTTSKNPSKVGLDKSTCYFGFFMLLRMVFNHKLVSLRRTNYIILGYEPSKRNKMGAVKTAYGSTFLAPSKSRTYALIDNGSEYELNMEKIITKLINHKNQPFRLIGFPAYMYFLIKELKNRNIKLKLHKKSMVMLGGGWKQFSNEEITKEHLNQLIEEVLGIKTVKEMFGVVEHNIPYFACCNHNFHIPKYARVIIRDPYTLKDVGHNQAGLLNLITPMLTSMPLLSVITDDVAIKNEGKMCGCGNLAPYFTVLGRANTNIKTCVNEAIDTVNLVKL